VTYLNVSGGKTGRKVPLSPTGYCHLKIVVTMSTEGKNCTRCKEGETCKKGAFGFTRLCIDCYCLLLYGPTNNSDPLDATPEGNTTLGEFA